MFIRIIQGMRFPRLNFLAFIQARDPDPTTQGWHSVWLTDTSARQPQRRQHRCCPHPLPSLPRGPVRTPRRPTSPVWTPGSRSLRCPTSDLRPGSSCRAAARCPPQCSRGAAPAAAREAAPTPLSREAPDTVRGPPAGRDVEPVNLPQS